MIAVALALAAIVAAASGGGTAPAEAQSGCAGVNVRTGQTGTWTTLPVPQYPTGESVVERHAIDPDVPGRWYVTNGKAIMASDDAGCTWRAAYVLPESATVAEPFDRTTAEIGRVAAAGNRVVATVRIDPADVPTVPLDDQEVKPAGTFVMRSEDGGSTWARGTEALPPFGSDGPLAVAQSDPKRVYLALGSDLHRSDDGGRTFTRLQPPAIGNFNVDEIVIDPLHRDVVFLEIDGLFRSTDAGQTWRGYAREEAGDFNMVGPAVSHPADGKRARVVTTTGDPIEAFFVSDDDGEKFEERDLETFGEVRGKAMSIAAGRARNDILLSTQPGSQGAGGHGIYRWNPASEKVVPIDEFRLAPLVEIQADRSPAGKFFMHAPRLLVIHEGPAGGPVAAPPPPPRPPSPPQGPDGEEGDVLDEDESPAIKEDPLVGTLDPRGGTVAVAPGESAVVDYELELPARTARLDTFFLLDTSGSTEPYIKKLREGLSDLASLLENSGSDAWFGLGEYQDAHALKYRRRADIRPLDETYRQALDTINTNGGAEPGYTAIHQVATGSGIPDPSTGDPVPPGKNAHWRRGAARTIVHFADEVFSRDPDGASPEEALKALVDEKIKFIGIVVSEVPVPVPSGTVPCDPIPAAPNPETGGNKDPVKLRCQLEKLAAGTGTVGPPGGLDCNGDGTVDVPEGKPMVCVITPSDTTGLGPLSKAVENLLLAIREERGVVLEPERSEAAVQVEPLGDFSKVDLHKENSLGFRVEFSCTEEQSGTEIPAPLVARVEDRKVARAEPVIRCGDLPPPAVPPEAPPAPAPPAQPQPAPQPQIVIPPAQPNVVALSPIPPPPPPALAPSAQVANAPAPSTAPAQAPAAAQMPVSSTAVNAQGAAAEQEEVQVTPVTVHVESGDSEGVTDLELSFARADAATEPGMWPWFARLFGVAAVLAGAASAMRRRQIHTQTRRLDR